MKTSWFSIYIKHQDSSWLCYTPSKDIQTYQKASIMNKYQFWSRNVLVLTTHKLTVLRTRAHKSLATSLGNTTLWLLVANPAVGHMLGDRESLKVKWYAWPTAVWTYSGTKTNSQSTIQSNSYLTYLKSAWIWLLSWKVHDFSICLDNQIFSWKVLEKDWNDLWK